LPPPSKDITDNSDFLPNRHVKINNQELSCHLVVDILGDWKHVSATLLSNHAQHYKMAAADTNHLL